MTTLGHLFLAASIAGTLHSIVWLLHVCAELRRGWSYR